MYTFRPFDHSSEADYETLVRLDNEQDNEGLTVDEQKHYDRMQDPKYRYARYFVEQGDKTLALAVWREPSWSYRPGKFFVNVIMAEANWDADAAHAAFSFLIAQTESMQANQWVSIAREDQPQKIALFQEFGLKVVMRAPRSMLDVFAFDPSPFLEIQHKVREDGFLILNAKQLAERDPDYLQKHYDMEWEIQQDVPEPDELTRRPFEQWKKMFESPGFYPEGYFYAVAPDGKLVGQTALWRSLGDPTILYTGLTGVLRPYRRKGIATALKVRAIAQAKEYGALRIETDNEENNPMFQLNLHLGFKPIPAFLDFEKKIV